MATLHHFVALYPPDAIATRQPRAPLRPTGGELFSVRPLVQTTAPMEVADDSVPPFILFPDLADLHRVVSAYGNPKDCKYITWLTRKTETLLRKRRARTWNDVGDPAVDKRIRMQGPQPIGSEPRATMVHDAGRKAIAAAYGGDVVAVGSAA